MSARKKLVLVSGLFFLTGSTALAAEVVLNRLLSYVFGYSYVATATVLAAYMAGLSAGAFVLGWCTGRIRRPLLAYGCLETLIALYLTGVPSLFEAFQRGSVLLARQWVDHPLWMAAVRFGLSFAFVFVPAFLMGGTLPILVRAFRGPEVLRLHLPVLYAINTLGGAAGTALGGYLLIARFGLDGTLLACALLDACVGAAAIAASLRLERGPAREPVLPEAPESAGDGSLEAGQGLGAGTVCALAFLQGALTFALEVVWSHLIGTVIGVTVYAFCIMLTAILLGIGIGSLVIPLARRWLRAGPLDLFIRAEALLALAVFASLFLWDRFPTFVRMTLLLKPELSFYEREAARFCFALALMLPATLAMGVALPCLTAAVRARPGASAGSWVGRVYAANTFGAILGALVTGLLLLGHLPSQRVLMLSGALALASGASALWLGSRPGGWSGALRGDRRIALGSLSACLLITLLFGGWDLGRLTAGSHYYWRPWDSTGSGRILFYREDPQSGFITVQQTRNGMRTMKTNGKYEGNNGAFEFQDLFALIGSLYVKHFERAVVVGLGPGRTLAMMHDLGYLHIDAVEYSPSIIEAARDFFPEFTRNTLDDASRVTLVCDDGRNFLQLAEPGYDFLTVAISGAAFAGVGNLYTREFFSLARSRLKPDGVFLLWLQGHHVPEHELRSAVFTLQSEFPYVELYSTELGDQLFLIASAGPLSIDPQLAVRLAGGSRVQQALKATGMISMIELTSLVVFTTPEELREFVVPEGEERGEVDLYTDFRPLFEYGTPRGLSTKIAGHNLRSLSQGHLPRFAPALAPGQEEHLLGRLALVVNSKAEAAGHFARAETLLEDPLWQEQARRLKPTTP